jgi:hypothetical protein
VLDCDEQGRLRHVDAFADDHLGDAIVRLYEAYAELAPEGPERERAAAVARSVSAWWIGALDFERCAASIATDVEVVDHRVLGTFSSSGREEWSRAFRGWFELADGIQIRADEVLALESDALLIRRTFLGSDRASGGGFERLALHLMRFDAAGRIARIELFETDREAEALAVFDEA